LSTQENISLDPRQNVPLALLGQCVDGDGVGCRRRRYRSTTEVEKLAVEKYKKNGKGITFNDLISCGLAKHKQQAQITLKYCLKNKVLFTISDHKPQQYYAVCLKSKILHANMPRNIPIQPTGVGLSNIPPPYSIINSKNNTSSSDVLVIQSLEGYVLPLLSSAPLYIHIIQLKLRLTRECYSELDLPMGRRNKGKEHTEIIGQAHIC
jgi:hypothetical protein